MKELAVGTRIFNGGDMANAEHFGTISHIFRNAHFGDQYEITPDPDSERTKPYCVSPAMFSDVYLGHGGTRFVTEQAYQKYRATQIAKINEVARARAVLTAIEEG